VTYRIEATATARRQVRRLPRETQDRVRLRVRALAIDPRPPGVTKLTGHERLYRIRVGDYRVIYEIRDEVLLVLVVEVGHRRDVYR